MLIGCEMLSVITLRVLIGCEGGHVSVYALILRPVLCSVGRVSGRSLWPIEHCSHAFTFMSVLVVILQTSLRKHQDNFH